MNSFIKLNSIMLIGLLPAIICMVLCIFFLDAYAIYGCTLLCAIYFIISKSGKSLLQPNIIFLHCFTALLICTLVKVTTGNYLIPDKAVPLTLQVIIFCLSLFYITFPNVYNAAYKFIFYKVSILDQMGSQLIVIFSMAYIFLSCIFFLFFSPINHTYIYWLTHIMPPIVYILCIIANIFTIISISKDYYKHPIIRIIGINDGKIMVSKRSLSYYENNKLDTPMEGIIFDYINPVEKATRIATLTLGINLFEAKPRFSIKYILTSPAKMEIILFILPIIDRNDIKYKYYKFLSPDEIKKNINKYSSFMKEEIEHLSVAAQIWKEQNPLD